MIFRKHIIDILFEKIKYQYKNNEYKIIEIKNNDITINLNVNLFNIEELYKSICFVKNKHNFLIKLYNLYENYNNLPRDYHD